MKKLIFQYFKGSSNYHEKSKISVKAYADRMGADYALYDGLLPLSHYYGTFFPIFRNIHQQYDAMCYIDSDVLVTANAENIFDHLGEGVGLSHMNTGPVIPEEKQDVSEFMEFMKAPDWKDIGHGNAGAVLFNNQSKLFDEFVRYLENLNDLHVEASRRLSNGHLPFGGFDQYILNRFNYDNGSFQLPWHFNYHLARYYHERRFEATLIHYHSNNKPLLHTDFSEDKILK